MDGWMDRWMDGRMDGWGKCETVKDLKKKMNMSWTCHELVMNISWTCYEHVMNMSWTWGGVGRGGVRFPEKVNRLIWTFVMHWKLMMSRQNYRQAKMYGSIYRVDNRSYDGEHLLDVVGKYQLSQHPSPAFPLQLENCRSSVVIIQHQPNEELLPRAKYQYFLFMWLIAAACISSSHSITAK